MYDQQSKRAGTAIFQGKMPRKNCANHAQAENLHKWQSQVTKPTVKDVEDDICVDMNPCPPSAHAHQNADVRGLAETPLFVHVYTGGCWIYSQSAISKTPSLIHYLLYMRIQ